MSWNNPIYLAHLERKMEEYYQVAAHEEPYGDNEGSRVRSPRLAELADELVRMFEEEAETYRRCARRWRGEN